MAVEELDYDYRVHQKKDNEGLAVRFYMDAIQNDDKSSEAGRPIFDDVEMIEKRVRGDRNNVVQRPAKPEDKREFRDAYKAFKEDAQQAISGTPLSQWPPITKSLLEELKYLGFHTVEQLSEASDAVCSKMAGLQTFKQKARVFIEFSKGNSAPIEQMASRLDELSNALEVANRNNAEMAAQIKALQATKK